MEFKRTIASFRPALPFIGLWIVFTVYSWHVLEWGHATADAYYCLPHFLGTKSVAAKVWDPKDNEYLGDYMARELDEFFNWVDCKFIDYCTRHGYAHFMSVTFYVFMLPIILLIRRWMIWMGFSESTAFLAICVLLTCPFFMLPGTYIQTAKIGVALCICLVMKIFGENRNPFNRKWIEPLILLLVGWAACWFDPQGFFLLLAALSVLAVSRGINWRNTILCATIGGVLLFAVLYDRVICPHIIYALNGYWPSLEYQHLPWKELMLHKLSYFWRGVDLLENNITQICGGSSRPDLGLVMLEIIGFGIWKAYGIRGLGIFALTASALVVMYVLMVLRHPPITSPACREASYYYIPGAVILFLFGCMAAKRLNQTIFQVVLCVLIAFNVYALPSHMNALRTDGSYVGIGPELLEAMNAAAAGRKPMNKLMEKDGLYKFFAARYSKAN